MPVLFLNCNSGISGDMFVASLIDLGKLGDYLNNEIVKLKLEKFSIKIGKIKKKGIDATSFNVECMQESIPRDVKDIFMIIDDSDLSFEVKFLARKIFSELAWAEKIAHKTSLKEVHFHEIGAIDSIVDIVCASILITKLGIDRIYYGKLREGSGNVDIAHGILPLPVPAVRELLSGFAIEYINLSTELITPTGAAILKAMDALPLVSEEKFTRTGYGAGTKDLPFPNVLEASLVENLQHDEKLILETNIDDMNPELFPYVIEKALGLGAIDAFISPAQMKKRRLGTKLTVICSRTKKDALINSIFKETTTFGIRESMLRRIELERKIIPIETRYGRINAKIGSMGKEILSIKPEFEDCKDAAISTGIPLKKVYEEIKEDINKAILR